MAIESESEWDSIELVGRDASPGSTRTKKFGDQGMFNQE